MIDTSKVGKLYQGSPAEVIVALSQEVNQALGQAGIAPTGVHILGMIWTVACAIRGNKVDAANGKSEMGNMPSFKMLLSLLTRGILGTSWNEKQWEEFNKEFVEIIKSLGGKVANANSYTPTSNQPVFLAPASKEIH